MRRGALYKQLDAPYGAFNHWLIVASTNGIKSDDATYQATDQAIQSLAAKRDALVLQMRDVLTADAKISAHLNAEKLAKLFEPMAYQGASQALIDRLLASLDDK